MKISIVIPIYNEEKTVASIIERVAKAPLYAPDAQREIIVVDDCSRDGTAAQLRLLTDPAVRVITHDLNRGKGAALRTGFSYCTGDIIIIQDADLEYNPDDYHKLTEKMLQEKAKVVYGVRSLKGQKTYVRMGNQFLTWATNLIYGCRIHDMETCYKLVDRGLLQSFPIVSNRFDMEAEVTAKILRRGHHIYEVPIDYAPRKEKKLSPWRDGLPAIWTLIKYRFSE
jgi:glycosyltransferase involved in cell wall biosynthesis